MLLDSLRCSRWRPGNAIALSFCCGAQGEAFLLLLWLLLFVRGGPRCMCGAFPITWRPLLKLVEGRGCQLKVCQRQASQPLLCPTMAASTAPVSLLDGLPRGGRREGKDRHERVGG